MSSSATMQQAKTEAAQPAQLQQSKASAVQSELSDLRPQVTAQCQLQDAANNSPQSHQLNTFQQMAQNSARSTQLKAMSAMMNAPAVQRVEEEEPLQAKSATETAQRDVADAAEAPKPNNTGLPDNLKSGVESLSGMSMDHVKVHYNSSQPAQLNAHAYAQGSEIHVAPGQERHLPHEAWHVVQQAQGRVKPTMQMKAGVPVNDDAGLEAEADVMGEKALGLEAVQMKQAEDVKMTELFQAPPGSKPVVTTAQYVPMSASVYQRVAAGSVAQLLYLQDRSTDEPPQWTEDNKVPPNYLPSGNHNDGQHGDDKLYVRLGAGDLFYGISYEENKDFEKFLGSLSELAVELDLDVEDENNLPDLFFEAENLKLPIMLDVELCKAIFGGSSGWDKYMAFLPGKKSEDLAKTIKKLNPSLKWADDHPGFECQMAMVEAISQNGSVRFLLDGMNKISGILEGTEYVTNVTTYELQFAVDILNKNIVLPDEKAVTPQDGVNVFFYLNRELIKEDQIRNL